MTGFRQNEAWSPSRPYTRSSAKRYPPKDSHEATKPEISHEDQRPRDPFAAIYCGVVAYAQFIGRDYADAAPVKGAIRTAGGQDSAQAVDVIPLD